MKLIVLATLAAHLGVALAGDYDDYVTLLGDNSGNKGESTFVTNIVRSTYGWSDGKDPHSGTNYYCGKQLCTPKVASGAYEFAGARRAVLRGRPEPDGRRGCPLLKRNFGENVEALMRHFPHWFCSDFGKYAGKEKSMPFDSHLLLACVAPRKLLVEGFDDPYYDTEGEFEALKAASPVWAFLGRTGLPRTTWPKAYDTSAVGADVGYVHRTERHGLSAYDWTWIMDFAKEELK